MNPTTISKLREMEAKAIQSRVQYPEYSITVAGLEFDRALHDAALDLLSSAEELERVTKVLSFDGCDADEVVSSMPNRFPDALVVRRSWFEGERRNQYKALEDRYVAAMDRLALAEKVVEAARKLCAEGRWITGLPDSDPQKGNGNRLADLFADYDRTAK